MRFKRTAIAAIGALLAVVLMLAASTGTAVAAEKDDSPLPSVTAKLHGYTLWFSQSDVKHVGNMPYPEFAGFLAGAACFKIPNAGVATTCGLVVTAVSFWIRQTFTEAEAAEQCVWITVEWIDLHSWGRYDC